MSPQKKALKGFLKKEIIGFGVMQSVDGHVKRLSQWHRYKRRRNEEKLYFAGWDSL